MLNSAFTLGSELRVKVRGAITVDVWLCVASEAERVTELQRHNTEQYLRATDVLARGFTMQVIVHTLCRWKCVGSVLVFASVEIPVQWWFHQSQRQRTHALGVPHTRW